MTDKELRRLSRGELLEMLIAQAAENDQLKNRLEQAEAQLRDRKIAINNAGSLAEAALSLNGVFQAAEAAAQEQIQKQPEPAEEKKSMSIAQRAHLADGLDNENGDDTDAQESSVSLEKKPEDEKSE